VAELVKYDKIRNCVGVQFVSFCTSYNFSLYKYCNMPVSNNSWFVSNWLIYWCIDGAKLNVITSWVCWRTIS